MAGLIDRIASLAGTELGKALELAHRFFQERMEVHNHMGIAILETAAEVARNHPNLVGIGVGLLVEQFLAEQKRRHDVYMAELKGEAEAGGPVPKAKKSGQDNRVPLVHHDLIPAHLLRPTSIAFEVFGALALLKLSAAGARWFRHNKQQEVWFAPAARIRLFSGTLAAYYSVKSFKSPKISAWRNAAVALFATDAMKPVLLAPKRRKTTKPRNGPPAPALTLPAAAVAPPEPPAAQPADAAAQL